MFLVAAQCLGFVLLPEPLAHCLVSFLEALWENQQMRKKKKEQSSGEDKGKQITEQTKDPVSFSTTKSLSTIDFIT